jgi:hypothetical protein
MLMTPIPKPKPTLLSLTMRGYFMDAACKIFEDLAEAPTPEQHRARWSGAYAETLRAAACVQAVLFDALRRAVVLGGRAGLPRSFKSVLGSCVVRFLGCEANEKLWPWKKVWLPRGTASEWRRCGAVTRDGTYVLHPCHHAVLVVQVVDGGVYRMLPYANAAQVCVADDGDIFIAHEKRVVDLRADFSERREFAEPAFFTDASVTGTCASADMVAAWYPCHGIALVARDDARLLRVIAHTPDRPCALGWNAYRRCIYAEDDDCRGLKVFNVDTCAAMPSVHLDDSDDVHSTRPPTFSSHSELCTVVCKMYYGGFELFFSIFVTTPCGKFYRKLVNIPVFDRDLKPSYIALADAALVIVGRDTMIVWHFK